MAGAVERILAITAEAEIGKIYTGASSKVVDFGAFVNICPARTACCTSRRSPTSGSSVGDYLEEGQMVDVVVLDVDQRGRIKLSMKEVENYARSA
jgi:polyribonucleotide nucleotidyltransferase